MARGLPCIGSTVEGIPELLNNTDLVPPNDPEKLASLIVEVATSPARRQEMAQRNLERARAYSRDVLSPQRRAFYTKIRDNLSQSAAPYKNARDSSVIPQKAAV